LYPEITGKVGEDQVKMRVEQAKKATFANIENNIPGFAWSTFIMQNRSELTALTLLSA